MYLLLESRPLSQGERVNASNATLAQIRIRLVAYSNIFFIK